MQQYLNIETAERKGNPPPSLPMKKKNAEIRPERLGCGGHSPPPVYLNRAAGVTRIPRMQCEDNGTSMKAYIAHNHPCDRFCGHHRCVCGSSAGRDKRAFGRKVRAVLQLDLDFGCSTERKVRQKMHLNICYIFSISSAQEVLKTEFVLSCQDNNLIITQ